MTLESSMVVAAVGTELRRVIPRVFCAIVNLKMYVNWFRKGEEGWVYFEKG